MESVLWVGLALWVAFCSIAFAFHKHNQGRRGSEERHDLAAQAKTRQIQAPARRPRQAYQAPRAAVEGTSSRAPGHGGQWQPTVTNCSGISCMHVAEKDREVYQNWLDLQNEARVSELRLADQTLQEITDQALRTVEIKVTKAPPAALPSGSWAALPEGDKPLTLYDQARQGQQDFIEGHFKDENE